MREADMFDPFWCWLERTRRIRRDTLYARELHWVGRRIDLAILTASGALTAYEFKLNHNRRAIEQAAYNAHSFHRSYVVTATTPSPRTLELAVTHGVGVLAFSAGKITVISAATVQQSSNASRRLRAVIQERGKIAYVQ